MVVLDRNNMDRVLAEQGFQQTGCTTSECAVQMGKMLNVKKIVIGDFGVMGGKYVITAKLVDVETSRILFLGNNSSLTLDPDVVQKACNELAVKIVKEILK